MKNGGMSDDIIFPRSTREAMAGWVYLPRFIDKIRLHLVGKLHADYQENFTKGFDAVWLKTAGLEAAQFIDVVKNSVTDGEVCDWVQKNVKKSDAEKEEFKQRVSNYGNESDATRARLKLRKEQVGLGGRDDIKTFADMIDADEKRI
ncbi:MAG: hypothetical protein JWM68_4362 [Verrucomicrobiales bacterium]|nr:hypothetical protein [Verrucomicrobiales bacterium]